MIFELSRRRSIWHSDLFVMIKVRLSHQWSPHVCLFNFEAVICSLIMSRPTTRNAAASLPTGQHSTCLFIRLTVLSQDISNIQNTRRKPSDSVMTDTAERHDDDDLGQNPSTVGAGPTREAVARSFANHRQRIIGTILLAHDIDSGLEYEDLLSRHDGDTSSWLRSLASMVLKQQQLLAATGLASAYHVLSDCNADEEAERRNPSSGDSTAAM